MMWVSWALTALLLGPFTSNLFIPKGQTFLLGEGHRGEAYGVSIDNIGRSAVDARIIQREDSVLITSLRIDRKEFVELNIPADTWVELENLGARRAHLTVVLKDGFVEGMRYVPN